MSEIKELDEAFKKVAEEQQKLIQLKNGQNILLAEIETLEKQKELAERLAREAVSKKEETERRVAEIERLSNEKEKELNLVQSELVKITADTQALDEKFQLYDKITSEKQSSLETKIKEIEKAIISKRIEHDDAVLKFRREELRICGDIEETKKVHHAAICKYEEMLKKIQETDIEVAKKIEKKKQVEEELDRATQSLKNELLTLENVKNDISLAKEEHASVLSKIKDDEVLLKEMQANIGTLSEKVEKVQRDAIVISEKQEALNQREDYIKNKYRIAGIDYI